MRQQSPTGSGRAGSTGSRRSSHRSPSVHGAPANRGSSVGRRNSGQKVRQELNVIGDLETRGWFWISGLFFPSG